jgi:hypothetical protein
MPLIETEYQNVYGLELARVCTVMYTVQMFACAYVVLKSTAVIVSEKHCRAGLGVVGSIPRLDTCRGKHSTARYV